MKTTERRSTMNGIITRLDPAARQLTIAGLVMNKTFEIAEDVIILTSVRPGAVLGDLKVGDEVDVKVMRNGVVVDAKVKLTQRH